MRPHGHDVIYGLLAAKLSLPRVQFGHTSDTRETPRNLISRRPQSPRNIA